MGVDAMPIVELELIILYLVTAGRVGYNLPKVNRL